IVAELCLGVAHSLVVRHALGLQFVGALDDMKPQLAIEIAVHANASEQVAETVIPGHWVTTILRVAQDAIHSFGQPRPALLLPNQLLAALRSQRVEPCFPVLFRSAPLGANQTLLFQTMQRRVK